MSGGDDTMDATPAPRPGTSVDLSQRMDRMERRQDKMEGSLNDLNVIVTRVESNQKHSDELSVLRHEAVKTGLDTLTGTVGQFIARIEGIIDGSIQTSQTRQGAEVMAQYVTFREKTIDRLEALEDHGDVEARATAAAALVKATALDAASQLKEANRAGFMSAFSATQKFALMLAAILSPLVTVALYIVSQHP